MATRDRDRELLLPVVSEKNGRSKSSLSSSIPEAIPPPHLHSGREAIAEVTRSWASKEFMTGCVILLPVAITFYIT